MLFCPRSSGQADQNNGPLNYKRERIFEISDEREHVQKKAFTKWINLHLAKANCSPVGDLFVDLQDGSKLLTLLEVLIGRQYVRDLNRDWMTMFNGLITETGKRVFACARAG